MCNPKSADTNIDVNWHSFFFLLNITWNFGFEVERQMFTMLNIHTAPMNNALSNFYSIFFDTSIQKLERTIFMIHKD